MKRKSPYIITAFIFVFLISLSSVNAFGVALPYWDSPDWTPLKLSPGESKIVVLTLQNTEPEDMTVEATTNSPIAKITGSSIFSVPSGEVNEPAKIKVEIPEDAKVGTRYKIYTTFQQVTSGEGGMLRLSGALTTNFPVEVVGEEESELYVSSPESPNYLLFIVLGVLLIGIMIFFIAKPKKRIKKK